MACSVETPDQFNPLADPQIDLLFAILLLQVHQYICEAGPKLLSNSSQPASLDVCARVCMCSDTCAVPMHSDALIHVQWSLQVGLWFRHPGQVGPRFHIRFHVSLLDMKTPKLSMGTPISYYNNSVRLS